MSSRAPNKPSKTESWPSNHGRLTLHLKSSDRILFRKVTDRGLPESVGSANVGKKCTVITGHKEVEGLQESEEAGKVEMFTGESLEISEGDHIFTCIADSRGLLSSVGLPMAGMDVTIILHLQEQEGVEKSTEKEEILKKLKGDLAKKQEQLNRLTERVRRLENE